MPRWVKCFTILLVIMGVVGFQLFTYTKRINDNVPQVSKYFMNTTRHLQKVTPLYRGNIGLASQERREIQSPVRTLNRSDTSETNLVVTCDNNIGRLANQIFRYAAMFGLANKLRFEIVTDPTNMLNRLEKVFNLKLLKHRKVGEYTTFHEKNAMEYDSRFEDMTSDSSIALSGYYQSWKYFRHDEEELKSELQFKDAILKTATSFLSPLLRNSTLVCIHARRGDMTINSETVRGYTPADPTFIHKVFDIMRQKYHKPRFLICSDSIDWCKTQFSQSDVTFSEGHTAAEDLAILSLCPVNVITSGTFGWWGAWLSGGHTYYWREYPKPGSWLDSTCNREDFYPANWTEL